MSVINLDVNKAVKKPEVKETPKAEVVTNGLGGDDGVAVIQDDGDKENVMIKMDGPLSRVYTDALNVYLSKEHLDNVSVANEQMTADATFMIKSKLDRQKENLYVYSLNVDDFDSDEAYADAYDEFAVNVGAHADYDKVVVLEAYKTRGAKLDKMHNYATRNGAKVFYTRKAALEYIKDRVFEINASAKIGQEGLFDKVTPESNPEMFGRASFAFVIKNEGNIALLKHKSRSNGEHHSLPLIYHPMLLQLAVGSNEVFDDPKFVKILFDRMLPDIIDIPEVEKQFGMSIKNLTVKNLDTEEDIDIINFVITCNLVDVKAKHSSVMWVSKNEAIDMLRKDKMTGMVEALKNAH